MEKETKDILLRGVPKEWADKLAKQAEKNLRSVNKQGIIALTEGIKKGGK